MNVFAIDPGPVQSAYVVWDGSEILEMDKVDNENLLVMVGNLYCPAVFVIEQIKSYGMAVGEPIFNTVFWSGRLCQAWRGVFHRVPRMDVKMHLCHDSRAKDSNIRQALIDRFEPELKPKQRPKGILKGVKADIWAALAVAVYFYDTRIGGDYE